MINGITTPVSSLDNQGVKTLIGQRVVAAKARGENSEWPVLGIGTVTGGTRDEAQIRMYVQFDDDDEIGLFEDEYIVLLEAGSTPDNEAANILHDLVGAIESDTQTLEEEAHILSILIGELGEFVTEAEANKAVAETRKQWALTNDDLNGEEDE